MDLGVGVDGGGVGVDSAAGLNGAITADSPASLESNRRRPSVLLERDVLANLVLIRGEHPAFEGASPSAWA